MVEKESSDEDGDYVHPSDSDTDSEVENKKKKSGDEVDRAVFFRGHQVLAGSILCDV